MLEPPSKEQLDKREDRALEEIDRAARAKAIFEDDLFKEAVDAVQQQLYTQFAATDAAHVIELQRANIGMQMLDRVLKLLRSHVDTGKLAEVTLNEVRAQKESRA